MVSNNVIALVGVMGTGKTLYSTYLLSLKKEAGCKIWSNYNNQYNDVSASAEELLLDLENRQLEDENFKSVKLLLALDELGNLLKSGDWMSSKNAILTKIVSMSRKLNTDIIYTTQHWSMVDRVIRRITTIYLDMNYDEESDTLTIDCFERDNDGLHYVETLSMSGLKRYYNKYDTYQIIEPNEYALIARFKKRVTLDKQLFSRWYNAEGLTNKIEVLSFYLKVQKKVARMIHLELAR